MTASQTGGEATVAGYELGPGDQVRITVFRHEDLSGEFEVDGEGFDGVEARQVLARRVW